MWRTLQSHLESAAPQKVLKTLQGGSALAASWKQGKLSGDDGLERLTKQTQNENRMKHGPSARLHIQIVQCECEIINLDHYRKEPSRYV